MRRVTGNKNCRRLAALELKGPRPRWNVCRPGVPVESAHFRFPFRAARFDFVGLSRIRFDWV